MFDVSQLTLGEIGTIEDLSGRSISELDSDDAPQGKLMAALAYVIKRRSGFPLYKWNEALGLTLHEAAEIIGLDLDDDEDTEPGQDGDDGDHDEKTHGEAPTPTEPAGKPAGKGSKPPSSRKK